MMKKPAGKPALLAALAICFAIIGCDLSDFLPGPNAILVQATIINSSNGWTANVILSDDGGALIDAEVQVNGSPCLDAGDTGTYYIAVGTPFAAQANVTLTITKTGTEIDISQSLTLPALITNISPVEDTYITATTDTLFTWTSPSPLPFSLALNIPAGPYSAGGDYTMAITNNTTTSHLLPANTLFADYTSDIPVSVASIKFYGLVGNDFEWGSNWQLIDTATVNIHTNP